MFEIVKVISLEKNRGREGPSSPSVPLLTHNSQSGKRIVHNTCKPQKGKDTVHIL